MEITTLLSDNWKEEKAKLQDSISDLKKGIKESKKERKSDWKALKTKFSDEIKKIEKSFKELKANRKK